MSMEMCTNGHIYDACKHSLCPYCKKELTIEAIPSRFKKLGKISFLGTGSISKVYKISGDNEYALKIVQCGTDVTKYQNALYELRIMEHLRGQNRVVQLYDYEIIETHESKTIYILEEYHVTMTDFLSSRTIFASDAIQIVIGICDAILACQKCGILHLDVQPKNIYVDNLESIKIGDFSSSLFENDACFNNKMRGTLAFVAPEVYRNGSCSIRSDIYSVGLILYSLFNKKVLPFMDSDSTEVSIYKRLAGTPLPDITFTSTEISNELNRIIRRTCSYSVEDRYRGIDELRTELIDLLKLVNGFPNTKEIIYTPFENEYKRTLPLIYVLQTSGSMQGLPISELNYILHETTDRVIKQADCNNVEVRTSILTFGRNTEWELYNDAAITNELSFSASGMSQLGAALLELDTNLTRCDSNGLIPFDCYLPMIIFVSNGYPVDEYTAPLNALNHNQWFKKAIKICFAVGEDSDLKLLSEIAGNAEAVLKVWDMDIFDKMINFVSVSSSIVGNSFDADSIAASLALPGTDSIVTSATLYDHQWDDDVWDADTWVGNSEINESLDAHRYVSTEGLQCGKPLMRDSGREVTYSNKTQENDETISLNDGIAVPNGMLAGGIPQRCRVCDSPIVYGANFCPYCGCKVVIETPAVELRKVEFSAIAPKMLVKGDYNIINVIMYEKSFRYIVDDIIKERDEPVQESSSGIYKVQEGSAIKIILSSPDIIIDDSTEIGIWQGEHLDFSFAIFLPNKYEKRQVLFNATVYVNDVVATKLKFIVKCSSILEQKIAITRQDILSAFISYASQDRNRVAAIIQGMKKARPDMDVFFDIDSLRSGDDWERVLHQEIEKRDILFLCWSHFARDSKWVDAEWRYALAQKGAEFIEPVPIEPPDICPPPKELNHKHFNDKLLYIINANSDNTHNSDYVSQDKVSELIDDLEDW